MRGWDIVIDGTTLLMPSTITVSRYRYRGAAIPNPGRSPPPTDKQHGHVESRMRGDVHVRSGGRAEETDRGKPRHRASARPITHIRTWVGFVYAAFVIDVFSRLIVGWQLATHLRYTERLEQAGVTASVGSRGDSYDNALAESVNGLFKAELIVPRGPWRSVEQVEIAMLEWIDWYNHRRLHSALGDIPPVEFEANHYAGLGQLTLPEFQTT